MSAVKTVKLSPARIFQIMRKALCCKTDFILRRFRRCAVRAAFLAFVSTTR
jgi:hypothetical protein